MLCGASQGFSADHCPVITMSISALQNYSCVHDGQRLKFNTVLNIAVNTKRALSYVWMCDLEILFSPLGVVQKFGLIWMIIKNIPQWSWKGNENLLDKPKGQKTYK